MENQVPAIITQSAQAQGLVLKDVNLIMPTETFGAILGEYDKITIETVRININDPREVYEPNGKGKGFAFSKQSLQRVASALSIQWHPMTGVVESTPTRSTEPRGKSRVKAVGMMQKPNGETVVQTEEKTIDIDVEYIKERAKQEKYAEDGRIDHWEGKKPIKVPWKSDDERERHIEIEVQNSIKQKIAFRDELALTGAKDRVIRAFLALKSTYTKEELSMPLAFPRVSLDSSKLLDNPELRQEAINRLPGNVQQLFGPKPAQDVSKIDISPHQTEAPVDAEIIEDSSGNGHDAEVVDISDAQFVSDEDDFTLEGEKTVSDPIAEAKMKLEEWSSAESVKAHKSSQGKSAGQAIQELLDDDSATLEQCNELLEKLASHFGSGVTA